MPPPHSPPRPVPPDDEPNLICSASVESLIKEMEVRKGVEFRRVHKQESGYVKTGFVKEWLRTDQGKALPTSTRELISELLDIAGPECHRYTTDARHCVAVIWAGQKHIADALGLTVAGVRSRMRAAAKAGLINRTKRAYGRSSLTVVELTLPTAAKVLTDDQKVPNAVQSGRLGSRRALKLQRAVRCTSNAQCDAPSTHLSDAEESDQKKTSAAAVQPPAVPTMAAPENPPAMTAAAAKVSASLEPEETAEQAARRQALMRHGITGKKLATLTTMPELDAATIDSTFRDDQRRGKGTGATILNLEALAAQRRIKADDAASDAASDATSDSAPPRRTLDHARGIFRQQHINHRNPPAFVAECVQEFDRSTGASSNGVPTPEFYHWFAEHKR